MVSLAHLRPCGLQSHQIRNSNPTKKTRNRITMPAVVFIGLDFVWFEVELCGVLPDFPPSLPEVAEMMLWVLTDTCWRDAALLVVLVMFVVMVFVCLSE